MSIQSMSNILNHINHQVIKDVEGTKISPYLIALEAWRRGLTVKWLAYPSAQVYKMHKYRKDFVGCSFLIESGNTRHEFYFTWGDKNTTDSFRYSQNKAVAKEYLIGAGNKVPEGVFFDETITDNKIIQCANGLSYPLVIKPLDQGRGRGVITNIQSSENLKQSLEFVRGKLKYKNIIVEKYITGREYRVYVIEDRVISAVYRRPPSIVGDGLNCIADLIKKKNEVRIQNPHIKSLKNPYILVDNKTIDYLKKCGLTLSSIPENNELIYVREKGNFSEGSDSVDFTEMLPKNVKHEIVKAVKAIPGLKHAGLDVIVQDINGIEAETYIIELNASALLGSHLYPFEGKPIDIPSELVDYYFPETKDYEHSIQHHYFDFPKLLAALKDRSAYSIELNRKPEKILAAKLFKIAGKINKTEYLNWIQKQAINLGFHGYAKSCIDGCLEVVVAGENDDDVAMFYKTTISKHPKALISKIESYDYINPIKVGFFIYDDLNLEAVGRRLRLIGYIYIKLRNSSIGRYINKLISYNV